MTRPSLRTAIDAKCRDCIHDPIGGGGTWREQVEACSSANCPLHPLRPISARKRPRKGVKAIALPRATAIALYSPASGLNGGTAND
jgi:hypothetical protein